MTVYSSTNVINDLQQQTEVFLQKVTSEWQMADPQKLLKQPPENAWSAAQCLEHLNSYGRYYLPEIEKAVAVAKENNHLAVNDFKEGILGGYFTRLMQPGVNGKKMVQMTSPKDHRPTANLNGDNVIAEFIDQQERLIMLLERARQVNLNKARVPISIAKFIKLKLGDVLRFVVAHNYRHMLQAERALAKAGIPVVLAD